jgi:hypothetical protein
VGSAGAALGLVVVEVPGAEAEAGSWKWRLRTMGAEETTLEMRTAPRLAGAAEAGGDADRRAARTAVAVTATVRPAAGEAIGGAVPAGTIPARWGRTVAGAELGR